MTLVDLLIVKDSLLFCFQVLSHFLFENLVIIYDFLFWAPVQRIFGANHSIFVKSNFSVQIGALQKQLFSSLDFSKEPFI